MSRRKTMLWFEIRETVMGASEDEGLVHWDLLSATVNLSSPNSLTLILQSAFIVIYLIKNMNE